MIKILLGVAVLLLSVAVVGMWIWHRMTGPLYQPGDVRAGKGVAERLTPPQAGGGRWLVAPDIELYHFEEGTGTPVLVVHGGPGFPPTSPGAPGDSCHTGSFIITSAGAGSPAVRSAPSVAPTCTRICAKSTAPSACRRRWAISSGSGASWVSTA